MRNQKGITLIALVITIIVLLILAGVSIAMLTGNNGILTQANNSKSETAKAEAVEKINLTLNAIKAKIYEEQVNESTYSPLDTTGTDVESKISPIMNSDLPGITKKATTDGEYTYNVKADGTLEISYKNSKQGITDPITGSITLKEIPANGSTSKVEAYTITAAK